MHQMSFQISQKTKRVINKYHTKALKGDLIKKSSKIMSKIGEKKESNSKKRRFYT